MSEGAFFDTLRNDLRTKNRSDYDLDHRCSLINFASCSSWSFGNQRCRKNRSRYRPTVLHRLASLSSRLRSHVMASMPWRFRQSDAITKLCRIGLAERQCASCIVMKRRMSEQGARDVAFTCRDLAPLNRLPDPLPSVGRCTLLPLDPRWRYGVTKASGMETSSRLVIRDPVFLSRWSNDLLSIDWEMEISFEILLDPLELIAAVS